ncbi:MAG: D-glycerate dehydrogenase [Dehalococcoidia bacterium]|nr:D-glycerate dehydrogenase [Dehalococcoidia bacterium]
MSTPHVFVTRMIAPEALALLRAQADVDVWPHESPPSANELRERAHTCDGLLTMLTDRVDAGLLDAAPRVRVISNMAVGYDNIQVPEATKRGVLIGTTPGVLTKTSAEFAFALLLAAARRVVEGDQFLRAGKWQTWHPGMLLGRDLAGATLGIVGLGAIGLEVAKRARVFEMHVAYTSRTRKPEEEQRYGLTWIHDLSDLLQASDFVSLHVALTEQTRHLIGLKQLHHMKRTAILVNTARGSVVDQKALYGALREGVIAGAALDVAEQEPMPLSEPLLTLPNVIVTPHIASASVATRTRMAVMAAQNLLAGLSGQTMLHCLNPQAFVGRKK